jgi:hypothetical protein
MDFKENLSKITELIDGISDFANFSIEFLEKEFKKKYNSTPTELIKFAMNYEEKYSKNYELEEVLKWFKENRPRKTENVLGCLLKDSDNFNGFYSLHHCFLDQNKKPLLGSDFPYLLVKASDLSPSLKSHFSNKNMILLQ